MEQGAAPAFWARPSSHSSFKTEIKVTRVVESVITSVVVVSVLPYHDFQTNHVAVHKTFEIYRQRNLVELAINRIKQFRRIATRYDLLAENYTAMLTIALILLWL
ncbi:MAG: transposase [Moorea sp. SIO3G5]|nr:transposase [Moorena sp. SIO3G5]